MGWMVTVGESRIGKHLIRVFAPRAGRRDDIVQEESGGPGLRRICVRCGTAVAEGDATCPVDGGQVVEVEVHVSSSADGARRGPSQWNVSP